MKRTFRASSLCRAVSGQALTVFRHPWNPPQ